MDTVIVVRRTKIGWEEMVSDMAAREATGSDDELSAAVEEGPRSERREAAGEAAVDRL
jgi:hypothetical protein